ncbi:MAG: CRTAC1 family protein [Acidobacteriota bacterium]
MVGLAIPIEAQWFHDVSKEVGIDFEHDDGRSGEKYYVETTASGGGFLDIDNDGDLDLYLVNGAPTPGSNEAVSRPKNVLYRNQDGRFVEIAEQAGVADMAYGMGLCSGDVDADGKLDFLVTNHGPDRLYRNLGDGRFEEIAAQAGVAGNAWSLSCALGDVDGDGDLDLYVTHYLDFRYETNPRCIDKTRNQRIYCQPEDFAGVSDALFINQGAGTFREEGETRGLAQGLTEKGMGVVMSDLDLDGDLDIYVANDGALNRLYVNDGKGHFEDQALLSGAGLNALGHAEAGMGIAIGDVSGDLRPDLVISHFALETNTYYRNLGGLQFEDETSRIGIGPPSYKYVGWGIVLFDFDNDGDLDLALANGHMQEGVEEMEPGLRYRQPNQLLENRDGRFVDVSEQAGPAFTEPQVSRGLAVGDWNNDGRLDLLVTNTNAPAQLLENRRETDRHWLGLELEGPPANPFSVGARVDLRAGSKRLQRVVTSGGSFMSQSDLRLHFGLGALSGLVEVEIHWPDGTKQKETITELDRYQRIAKRKP